MWCPGSGVVLDCIDSLSLPSSLLVSLIVAFSDHNKKLFAIIKIPSHYCPIIKSEESI